MAFRPVSWRSYSKYPPITISIVGGRTVRCRRIFRVTMMIEFAAERLKAAIGDNVEVLEGYGDDRGVLRIRKTETRNFKFQYASNKSSKRLALGVTNIVDLVGENVTAVEPLDVQFLPDGVVQFRLPVQFLKPLPKAAIAPIVRPPAKNSRLGCPNDPMQPPLPPGHPKRNVTPAIKVNGNGHEAPRVVLTNEPAPAVRGSVMS